MNQSEHEYLSRTILPHVADLIGMGKLERDQLRLASCSTMEPGSGAPQGSDGLYRATVYWQSLYVCDAQINEGRLVLHSWRPTWANLGRQLFDVEPWEPTDEELSPAALCQRRAEQFLEALEKRDPIAWVGWIVYLLEHLDNTQPEEELEAVLVSLQSHAWARLTTGRW